MNTKSRSPLIGKLETIYRRARENRDGECCMVAPHPDLQDRLKKDLAQLRSTTTGHMANLLQLRDRTSPGLNDGLIYPGDLYPLGTPLRIARTGAADRAPLRGRVRVIVVLVQFSDRAMGATYTKQHFQDLFFSTGVLPHGSVKEYYQEVTNNLVDIVGEVVGPYQMPMTLAQYAHGASGTGGTPPNARTMARDAALTANPDVNFAPYDNDGDGYVDAFIVIHAGPGAEVTGSPNDIWSHKWVLSDGAYNADGTQIYAYLTVPEDAKIGVCCHELGHLLFGFPDLYDTDYSSEGVGNWCLMGGGSWNGGGDIPAHASAWCKANQGWASVVNQTTNANVSINDVKASRQVYRLWKDGAAGSEYFLVENRQRMLYDLGLPGDGLLIWHVDETITSNSDENHPKVALVQADGQRDLTLGHNRGDAGDPYPGSANNAAFNATSTPNSKSYAGADTCVAVTNIGPSGPIMTARLSVKCAIKRKEIKELKELRKDNLKELRKEISEKNQRKETKDFKDFKESEKPIKEKDKDAEKPGEWPGGGGFGRAPEQAPYGAGDLEMRVAALEARLAVIQPFIDASIRPDLRQSALSSEEDLQDLHTQMQEGAANAKRLYDSAH
jgi:immune inhibitor A